MLVFNSLALVNVLAGMPADDSWLGHKMIDPAKGKASAPGPEQLRGRRDLTDIVSQTVLHDPK